MLSFHLTARKDKEAITTALEAAQILTKDQTTVFESGSPSERAQLLCSMEPRQLDAALGKLPHEEHDAVLKFVSDAVEAAKAAGEESELSKLKGPVLDALDPEEKVR